MWSHVCVSQMEPISHCMLGNEPRCWQTRHTKQYSDARSTMSKSHLGLESMNKCLQLCDIPWLPMYHTKTRWNIVLSIPDPFLQMQGITWDNCQCLPTLLYNEVVFFLVDVRKLDRVICKPQSRCQVISRFNKLYLIICLWWMLRNAEELSYLIHSGENKKILYFELSPPWHLYVLLLANLLAFYLAYLLAFYLAYLLAFYLAYLLAFYLAYLLAYLLALYLAFYLAYLLAFYLAFYLANLLAFYLANILALYLAYLLAFYLTFYLAYLLAFYLAYLLAFYLAYLLALYLAYLLAFYLAVEVQRCSLSSEGPRLRSSGAHWARRVPGWGPAVLTELGRSQVEVQRCSLSSEGPLQLRSSSAHCVRKLAKSLAKSWQGGSEHGSGCKGGGGEAGGEGGGEGGGGWGGGGGGGEQLW